MEYRRVVRVAEVTLDSNQDYLMFGQIVEILVWEDEKIFVFTVLDTVMFDAHYIWHTKYKRVHKHLLEPTMTLQGHAVFDKILRHGKYYVVDKDTAAIELL